MKGFFDEIKEKLGRELTNKEKDEYLKLIDTKKNIEGKYLDAFGKPVTFNGINGLKYDNTKLELTEAQQREITACRNDINYFVDNYCKIVTRNGVERPEHREYQKKLLKNLNSGFREILIHFPRQSAKTTTVSMYFLYVAIFSKKKLTIGIGANLQKTAVEVLNKIKEIFINLPIWLQQGLLIWNVNSIKFGNGVTFLTSATNADSFRGFTLDLLYIDENDYIDKKIWEEFKDSVFPTTSSKSDYQIIQSSTANGINIWYYFVEGARKNKVYKAKEGQKEYENIKIRHNGKILNIKDYYNLINQKG